LLYEPTLNYQFVANHPETVGQIWLYMPQVMQNALGIQPDQVKAYKLKPYAPAGSNGDPSSLMTLYLAYIPSEQVDPLTGLLQSSGSQYFTASEGIPGQLAKATVPGFPILYTPDPNPGGSGISSPSNSSTVTSDSSNKRRNAIIGVCASIGGIALLVLGWWIVRSYKRRQEGMHTRLGEGPSDPLGFNQGGYRGYGATEGEMQQRPPSVGPDGIRRNSFYFAEDSLRGYRDHVRDEHEDLNLASGSGQARRQVGTSRISPPILRENSMNW